MKRSLTIVCSLLLSAVAVADEGPLSTADPGAEKSIDGYGHCDQILQQSLFNRIIHNRAEYERQVLERRFLSMTEEEAYKEYSRNYESFRESGGSGEVNIFGFGSGSGGGGSESKYTEAEHKKLFREFKQMNSQSVSWNSESSLITNYASYIRDPASVNAWKECVTQRPQTDVYCFGARDQQGNGYVSVQWVPYWLAGVAPRASISFDHHPSIYVEANKPEQVALGTGRSFTVHNDAWGSAKPYYVNVNAEAYSGDELVGNYTCRATIPPLELPVLEIPQGPSDDEICEDERRWAYEKRSISLRAYNLYKRTNMAPKYRKAGDRYSGIHSWLRCDLIVHEYQ